MLFGQRDVEADGFILSHCASSSLEDMCCGRMLGFTLHVIAVIFTHQGQGMREDLPAGMAVRRSVVTPYLDLRLTAAWAGHVIRKWLLLIRNQQEYAPKLV